MVKYQYWQVSIYWLKEGVDLRLIENIPLSYYLR